MCECVIPVDSDEWEKLIQEDRIDEVTAKCHFCQAVVTGMFYCFGCKHFVCDACDSSAECDGDVGGHRR